LSYKQQKFLRSNNFYKAKGLLCAKEMSPLIDRFHSKSIGLGRSLVCFILNRLVYRPRNQYAYINNHKGTKSAYGTLQSDLFISIISNKHRVNFTHQQKCLHRISIVLQKHIFTPSQN